MISDTTTFFLAFGAVFLGLAAYMFKMDRDAKRLEFRIQVLEQSSKDATAKKQGK